MARIDVVMPQMGESIAEGTLSKWLKKVGDAVKRDEPIFEISTDKVDAEIPAPNAGTLAEIVVTEGQTVAVGTVVARIETTQGAAVAGGGAGNGASAATGAGAPPKKQDAPAPAAASHPSPATPSVPSRAPAPAAAAPNTLEGRLRAKSSPLVRKIAAEHGIEIAALSGSGIAGRVTKRDIMQALESGSARGGARPAFATGGGDAGFPLPQGWSGDVVEPMSKMRALTSEHMVNARRHAAHVTSFFEVDLTRVGRIRQKNRVAFEQQTGQKLTFLPFVIKAVTDCLKRHPMLNAAHDGRNIIHRKQYNVGIAVALDWGLIVPVIKGADDLSLAGLTRQLNDLAARARAKKLQPAEVQNATFTITNPGVFGSLMGTPIIPLGTAAIMGLGAIEKRPKVISGPDGEDTIAIRTCAYFSISFDHRIVDGADADRFMADVKQTLESFPETAL
ncbi:MAG TPA: dihydrolipoamide acetyltransferase family protein [Gemmatimonadaceae bacterium]|nr:dihydrolipoamide acetyltransferase family protein [Gemmatimonadaceae bacterium]